MKKHINKTESFFMLTPKVRDKLLEAKLTAAQWRIWSYLVSLDPFGDRGAKFCPAELMIKCSVKKTTYFAAKAKFQKLGLFDFKDGVTKVINLQIQSHHSKISDYSQQTKLIESEISDYSQQTQLIESEISESEFEISESQSEISEFQSSKPASDKASGSPQTIQTFQTFQTGAVVEKTEPEKTVPNQPKPEVKDPDLQPSNAHSSLKPLSDTLVNSLNSTQEQTARRDENGSQIPIDLQNKLEELEIPLDARVRKAIGKHHLSQAYGAVAHIERTRETIHNPRGVFLYQIAKQPVEGMGTRGRVMTAADFGYTLADVKRMYPHKWEEAAGYFGLSWE